MSLSHVLTEVKGEGSASLAAHEPLASSACSEAGQRLRTFGTRAYQDIADGTCEAMRVETALEVAPKIRLPPDSAIDAEATASATSTPVEPPFREWLAPLGHHGVSGSTLTRVMIRRSWSPSFSWSRVYQGTPRAMPWTVLDDDAVVESSTVEVAGPAAARASGAR